MIELSFLGGVGEVGGSMALLEDLDYGTKALLDCGLSLSGINKWYSEYLQLRKFNSIDDLIDFGVIPDIKGIYRQDYLEHMGRGREEKGIDAVLLTHAHIDHSGLTHFLRHDIDVWMNKPTQIILYALQEIVANPFYEFLSQMYSFQYDQKVRGKGHKRLVGKEVEISKIPKIFEPNERFEINGLEIEAYDVDHSLPGCSAFIVHTSSGPMVYIGDIRLLGRRKEDTERFIEAAAKVKPIAMICEGTRVDKTEEESEEGVLNKALEVVERAEGMVFVEYASRDLDRLTTFYEIAKITGRKLVIDSHQAFLLELFKEEDFKSFGFPKITYKNMGIYLPRKGWGLIDREDLPEELVEQDYDVWERKYIRHKNRVTLRELRNNHEQFMFFINYYKLNDLKDIKPPKGSAYIKSAAEPFNPYMELEEERKMLWLEWFKLPMYKIHASGHMNYEQTKEMINAIKPQLLIPIHTQHPQLFWGMYDSDKIRMVEKGERVTL